MAQPELSALDTSARCGNRRGEPTRRPVVSVRALPQRRSSRSVAVSLAVHMVLGAALVRLLLIPYPLRSFFRHERAAPVRPERISFVAVPGAALPAGSAVQARSGGNGRPVPRPVESPALVAPSAIPSELPPPRAATPPASPPGESRGPAGSGPVIGGGGETRGVQPSYSDPRVWVPAAPVVSASKTPAERLDSVVTTSLGRYQDSVAAVTHAPSKFERGDWTVDRNGQKWGIDQKFIHLGKVSIPTAVLALLPLNQQGNPIAADHQRTLDRMRADILQHAQASMNEDEFRNRVRQIRERKERERRERERDAKVVAPDAKNP